MNAVIYRVSPTIHWVSLGGKHCGSVAPTRSGRLFTPTQAFKDLSPFFQTVVLSDVDDFIALQALTARLLS